MRNPINPARVQEIKDFIDNHAECDEDISEGLDKLDNLLFLYRESYQDFLKHDFVREEDNGSIILVIEVGRIITVLELEEIVYSSCEL